MTAPRFFLLKILSPKAPNFRRKFAQSREMRGLT